MKKTVYVLTVILAVLFMSSFGIPDRNPTKDEIKSLETAAKEHLVIDANSKKIRIDSIETIERREFLSGYMSLDLVVTIDSVNGKKPPVSKVKTAEEKKLASRLYGYIKNYYQFSDINRGKVNYVFMTTDYARYVKKQGCTLKSCMRIYTLDMPKKTLGVTDIESFEDYNSVKEINPKLKSTPVCTLKNIRAEEDQYISITESINYYRDETKKLKKKGYDFRTTDALYRNYLKQRKKADRKREEKARKLKAEKKRKAALAKKKKVKKMKARRTKQKKLLIRSLRLNASRYGITLYKIKTKNFSKNGYPNGYKVKVIMDNIKGKPLAPNLLTKKTAKRVFYYISKYHNIKKQNIRIAFVYRYANTDGIKVSNMAYTVEGGYFTWQDEVAKKRHYYHLMTHGLQNISHYHQKKRPKAIYSSTDTYAKMNARLSKNNRKITKKGIRIKKFGSIYNKKYVRTLKRNYRPKKESWPYGEPQDFDNAYDFYETYKNRYDEDTAFEIWEEATGYEYDLDGEEYPDDY